MQKNKRYWLRGGIITAVIYTIVFILFIIYYLVTFKSGVLDMRLIFAVFSGLPLSLLIENFANLFFVKQILDHSQIKIIFMIYIFCVLNWFLIGLVFSCIYGKIRNRNKK